MLALTEGALARRRDRDSRSAQLRKYVDSVLMPDNKLLAMIERRNLYQLRNKLGIQFAID